MNSVGGVCLRRSSYSDRTGSIAGLSSLLGSGSDIGTSQEAGGERTRPPAVTEPLATPHSVIVPACPRPHQGERVRSQPYSCQTCSLIL